MSPEVLELHTYLELECLEPSPSPWSNSKPLAFGEMLTASLTLLCLRSPLLSNRPHAAGDLGMLSQTMSNQDLKF